MPGGLFSATEGVTIPFTGSVDPQFLGDLGTVERLVLATGNASERAGQQTAQATVHWSSFATGLNQASQLTQQAWRTMNQLADGVIRLTAEQENLNRTSANTGLDWDRAANAAGRFTDEVDVQRAGMELLTAGIQVNQNQLDQITRRAAIFAQQTGVETSQALDTLTGALISGSARALRPFGADLVALGGESHTAQQRLDGLTTSTSGMSTATDDARTKVLRLRDSIDDAERSAAHAAVTHFGNLITAEQELSHESDATSGHLSDLGDSARRFAVGGVDLLVGGFHLAATAAGGLLTMVSLVGEAVSSLAHGHADFNFTRELARETESHRVALANLMSGETQARAARDEAATAALAGRAGAQSAEAPAAPARPRGGGADASRLSDEQLTARGGMVFGANAEEQDRIAGLREISATMAPANDNLLVPGMGDTFERAQSEAEKMAQLAQSEAERMAQLARQTTEDRARIAQEARDRDIASRSNFHDQIAAQFRDHVTLAQHSAQLVRGAFDSMTDAVGRHFTAYALGKESFGVAMRGMAADVATSIAEMAGKKAALEAVEAIASAASFNFPAAALHAAAAVGFGALALGAGAVAQAAAPAPSAASGGGSAEASRAAPVGSAGRAGGDSGPAAITLVFNREVIGGSSAEIGEMLHGHLRAAQRLGRAA